MAFFTKRLDRRIAAYQQELLETHYREVENMYREMRGWRHDYRNHIQLLKMYAQNGDLDAIRAYLDALETDLTRVDTVVKTGNRMADAILNSKISLAKPTRTSPSRSRSPTSTCASSSATCSTTRSRRACACRRRSG